MMYNVAHCTVYSVHVRMHTRVIERDSPHRGKVEHTQAEIIPATVYESWCARWGGARCITSGANVNGRDTSMSN